jgi:FPC/CPF motif-containing protein YcgG
MKNKKVIFRHTIPIKFDGKKWTYSFDEHEVIVMAVVDGYAMIKRPGCMPFVVNAKDLEQGLNDRS